MSAYSDHYSVEVVIGGLPRATRQKITIEEDKCTWNLQKEGGWEEYKKQTDKMSSKMTDIVEDDTLTIEDCMKEVDKVNNKVKFSAFGKTRKTNVRKKPSKETKCLECGRMEGMTGYARQLDTE